MFAPVIVHIYIIAIVLNSFSWPITTMILFCFSVDDNYLHIGTGHPLSPCRQLCSKEDAVLLSITGAKVVDSVVIVIIINDIVIYVNKFHSCVYVSMFKFDCAESLLM